MESGTLPPPTMLLHPNDSFQQMSSSHSPMNQYSDVYSTKSNASNNNKTTKRKFEDLIDTASGDFESTSPVVKPQKLEQQNLDPERSLSRNENPSSNGSIPPSSTPRNGNENGSFAYDVTIPNNNNNMTNNGQTSPNAPILPHQTPPPPSLQQPQSMPSSQSTTSSSQSFTSLQNIPSYLPPMSPRNQYAGTSDSPFLQTNKQVFVFTTQLANEAAESVLKNEYPNIIEYHRSLPSTAQYLSSISNNMHPNQMSMIGGPMGPNQGPPSSGCHSPRTMQMMMNGHPPQNLHLSHPNTNGGGPPSNWSYPHFHPHQQQPPFGRLTPGAGGLPPPSHLPPPGTLTMNGSSPPPGMRMGGLPPMSGMGQPLPDGTENLTPERATHRKNQLSKIEDLKTKITAGRARNGRSKANAAPANGPRNLLPPGNGIPPHPGHHDPHSQQMIMMNSSHGAGPPPHHMMGMRGPPPPHMMPPGMREPPDGMMLEMNGPPPHLHMNGPMPPNFPSQYGPGPGNDPFCGIPPPHGPPQAMRDWKKMQIDHLEGKMPGRGQPPPYSSASPSGMTPPMATSSTGGPMCINGNTNGGKLASPKMESASALRLFKVGPPEKFHPDSLPSAPNKKSASNTGEVQMTASPLPMDYKEIGMEGEELIITRHLNQAYRSSNGNTNGNSNIALPSSSSSSSSCKDEPMTPLTRSTSTPNNNANPLSCGKPATGSTTPSQTISSVSPRSSKLSGGGNLTSPIMVSTSNASGKDDPLDMNGGPRTPTSNMAPPLSSMLQMTNSLQSANSPYNSSNGISSNNSGLKNSSSMSGNPPSMSNQNLGHMNKPMDSLSQPPHMQLPPHQPSMIPYHNNMNPQHRMIGPPDSMPPHFHPHHGPNLPPQAHPQMYKMRPPHPSMDPSGMMMPHPGGPMRAQKGMPLPGPDAMPPYPHNLPPQNYGKMPMDPMAGPPIGHPQQHMRYGPMMDDGFGMIPPPQSHHPHHPLMHPHMHQQPPMHHPQMHSNDGRLGGPPPQPINNTYVSTTMSIQQLNIQNLGPGGGPNELQSGTIHYHAPPGNILDCPPQQQSMLNGPPGSNSNPMFAPQQQFPPMSHMPPNDPSYPPQFNDLQPIQSNMGVDGVQPSPYW